MRGTLKGALAALVLFLLGILIWLLIEQFQETLEQEHLASVHYSADLADHISLSLALKAETALNQLPLYELPRTQSQQQAVVNQLRAVVPNVQSLALLSPAGDIVLDSSSASPDAAFLKEWVRSNPPQGRGDVYYYGNNRDASVIYLRLRPPE